MAAVSPAQPVPTMITFSIGEGRVKRSRPRRRNRRKFFQSLISHEKAENKMSAEINVFPVCPILCILAPFARYPTEVAL